MTLFVYIVMHVCSLTSDWLDSIGLDVTLIDMKGTFSKFWNMCKGRMYFGIYIVLSISMLIKCLVILNVCAFITF